MEFVNRIVNFLIGVHISLILRLLKFMHPDNLSQYLESIIFIVLYLLVRKNQKRVNLRRGRENIKIYEYIHLK